MHTRFCPQCGRDGTLQTVAGDAAALGRAVRGCYDGSRYCFEGPLPTLKCEACGFTFATDVTDDDIHDACNCKQNPLCTCGRYQRAKGLRASRVPDNMPP